MSRDSLAHMPPPWQNAPEPKPLPRCPVCMSEAREFYIGYWGTIVGCDGCINVRDAEEYTEENSG